MDQKVDWKIERILEVVFILFLAAAALGVFGGLPSPSKQTTHHSGIKLTVEYPNATRSGLSVNTQVIIQNTGKNTARKVQIQLDRRYLEGFSLQRIAPEPETQRAESGNLILEYGPLKPGKSMQVVFDLDAQDWGRYSSTIKVQFIGKPTRTSSVRFQTLVWP